MRHIMKCLMLTSALAGCDSPTESAFSPPTGANLPLAASRADGPGIDRSLLQPQLFPGLDWGCRWVADHSQILCTANAKDFDLRDTFEPEFDCPDGGTVYSKGSRSLIARRLYNSDYQLVQRILHWYQLDRQFSSHPDGSGTTASGRGGSSVETYDYGIPGNFDEGVTVTIRGLEAEIRLDAPGHRLLAIDKGEIRIDPSGDFTIISGQWDFFTDFDGAVQRVCSALT